ncbi:uncharacterized protein LOC131604272 [Vicia villosa]|uniref:uncharacterized protein LOC131604272 n=1 Tax=Vicia villosa TaxID=3911 RepID=UPI00273BF73C|nr:uncharacterized protein LOC131604272 [Vicia villosa]
MDNTTQSSSISVPIFNGENYDFWRVKMETYFSSQDLWDIVEEGFTVPADTSTLNATQEKELKKNKQKNSKALFTLQQAVTDAIFPRIMGAKSAKDAWNTLKEEFQGSDKVRAVKLQSLRRDFELLKMKDIETVKDYYSKVKEIVNQMRAFGDDILDKKIVEKILITMPPKFDPIVTTIEETKDLPTLSVTELVGSLEAYEQRLNRHKEDTLEDAFRSKLKFRPQNKEGEGKKSYGETSRRSEASRNFFKNKGRRNLLVLEVDIVLIRYTVVELEQTAIVRRYTVEYRLDLGSAMLLRNFDINLQLLTKIEVNLNLLRPPYYLSSYFARCYS